MKRKLNHFNFFLRLPSFPMLIQIANTLEVDISDLVK